MNARVLLDALLPPSCAACGAPCGADDALCARCHETVAPPPADVPTGALFGGALADAVRQAKFRPDYVGAKQLARWLARRVQSGDAPAIARVIGSGSLDAVAFVPAPLRRRVARGFDLPALLAQALAPVAKASVVDALACTRHDAPLSHGADKAARAAMVKGRYRVRGAWSGKRVMLVDDVRTTGATLQEAAQALEDAGAQVASVTLAVAP